MLEADSRTAWWLAPGSVKCEEGMEGEREHRREREEREEDGGGKEGGQCLKERGTYGAYQEQGEQLGRSCRV